MSDFSFRREIKSVVWGSTLALNAMRAFIASLVWVIIILMANSHDIGKLPGIVWALPLVGPLAYLFVYLPIGMVAAALSSFGVPLTGLLTIVVSLMVVVADPFLLVLKQLKPRLVPVDQLNLINFTMIIWVLKGQIDSPISVRK